MLIKKLTFAAVAFFFAFTGTASRGQDAGPLFDLLVRKRLITDQEAEEVRTELVKESASTAAGPSETSSLTFASKISFRCDFKKGSFVG
ncbi:MAG: hypothetical protein C5B58_02255, partial [Acidobacteria bacterium]